MFREWRERVNRWAASLDAPGRPFKALGYVATYAALRAWVALLSVFPMSANLVTAGIFGEIWWLISARHRERALDNLRHALGDVYSETELRRIARHSFRHMARVYLVELCLAPRLVSEWSWARYVELDDLSSGLRELLTERGAILVTPHFGNYELLGYTLAQLGFHLNAVMRPLDNPLLNEHVMSTREAGGLSLLIKKGAANQADALLAAGKPVCFIADQDAGRKGNFAVFFGRRASHYKSIGLLAMRHRVPIVCGSAARTRDGFHYRVCVQRVIHPHEWADTPRPLAWITQQYALAMEAAIRAHPEQYLWMHRRWKSRPPDELEAAAPAGTTRS